LNMIVPPDLFSASTSRGCPVACLSVLYIRRSGTFAGFDLPRELRAFLNEQTGTVDIAPNVRSLRQPDRAVTEYVPGQLPENDNRVGAEVCRHAGVLADGEMLLVMDHIALEESLDHQAFGRRQLRFRQPRRRCNRRIFASNRKHLDDFRQGRTVQPVFVT
jgi:hypothetical protein